MQLIQAIHPIGAMVFGTRTSLSGTTLTIDRDEICALVRHKGWSVARAVDNLVQGTLKSMNVNGAVIALDPKGNLSMSYHSENLPRGYVTDDGKITTLLYDKPL